MSESGGTRRITKELTLGIEICLGQCAVALLEGDTVRASHAEVMDRGHAERLPEMVREILEYASATPGDIAIIGVTCGPGSFTGARLGVAYARGLALATGCKAVGISTLELIASQTPRGRIIAAVDGRRAEVFAQCFQDGQASEQAIAITLDPEAVTSFLQAREPASLAGPGAALLRDAAPNVVRTVPITDNRPDGAAVARLAQRLAIIAEQHPARPIYLRAPDAKLPTIPA